MPIVVSNSSATRAHQAHAGLGGAGISATDALNSGSQATGGFQDFMSTFVAALEAEQSGSGTAASGATSPQANSNAVLALLAKLGIKPGDATDETAGTAKTDTSSNTTAGTDGVPVALQPQLAALGFSSDTGLAGTAAQKAIDVATSGTPGAGLLLNALSRALGGTGATGTAQQSTDATASATQAATQANVNGPAEAAGQTGIVTGNGASDAAALAAKGVSGGTDAAAKAELAAQGVVSITGKAAAEADAQHTVANQTAPRADDPAANTAHVALSALQQKADVATTPLSRMADIRAKLQAAQLGAGKSPAAGSATSATTTSGTMGDILTSATGGTPATLAASGVVDPIAKQSLAQIADKATAMTAKAGDQTAPSDGTSDKSSGTSSTLSDRIDAQFSASLANLSQNQTTQTTAQTASLINQAIPLSAVASTIAAHAKAGSSEFNIRLDPAGLGQIDVKMKVSSDGEVRAHLIVDQPATLDLMMRDRQHLQQQLDQAGFKTDSSSLQFSLRDQGQGSGQQQAWQQQTGSSRPATQTNATDGTTTQAQPVAYARQSYVRTDAVDISI